MKRLALLAAFVGSLVLSGETTHASGISPTTLSHAPVLALRHASTWHGLHQLSFLRPQSETQAPANAQITNATQVRLPDTIYTSGLTVKQSQPVNATGVDNNPNYEPFSGLHDSILNVPYSATGMLGGWYGWADESLGSTGFVEESYLASYYQNSDQAKNVITMMGPALSAIASTGNGSNFQTCSIGDQCLQVLLTLTDSNGTPFDGEYRIVLVGNAVLEIEFDIDQADYNSSNQAVGASFLDNASRTFVSVVNNPTSGGPTPTPPPTPRPTPPPTPQPTPHPTQVSTSFSITSVRIEKKNAPADPQFSHPALAKVKSGSTVFLSVYVSITSAPGNAPVSVEWTVRYKTRTLLDQTRTGNLDANPSGENGRLDAFPVKLTGKGTFVVDAKVTINGVSQQSETSVLITKKKKKK